MDDLNEDYRLHSPFCSFFLDYRMCDCGYRQDIENRAVTGKIHLSSDQSMSNMHGKLNDLFQIIKSQYRSGAMTIEEYQKALEIMSS